MPSSVFCLPLKIFVTWHMRAAQPPQAAAAAKKKKTKNKKQTCCQRVSEPASGRLISRQTAAVVFALVNHKVSWHLDYAATSVYSLMHLMNPMLWRAFL